MYGLIVGSKNWYCSHPLARNIHMDCWVTGGRAWRPSTDSSLFAFAPSYPSSLQEEVSLKEAETSPTGVSQGHPETCPELRILQPVIKCLCRKDAGPAQELPRNGYFFKTGIDSFSITSRTGHRMKGVPWPMQNYYRLSHSFGGLLFFYDVLVSFLLLWQTPEIISLWREKDSLCIMPLEVSP